jgi:cell wall-associated NlpC family hydrolase
MTAPTPASLALFRSTLPVKRVAPGAAPATGNQFASLLKASAAKTLVQPRNQPLIFHTSMVSGATEIVPGGPNPVSRTDVLKTAERLMGVPYVWGGTADSGMDCSAFVSKVWGVSRHTTDNLSQVSHPISKDELQAGDALNLTTGADPDGDGHVRLFDKWADAAHTKMWVYEETPPRSVHHVINWDPKYQPMRRTNVVDA